VLDAPGSIPGVAFWRYVISGFHHIEHYCCLSYYACEFALEYSSYSTISKVQSAVKFVKRK